MPHTDFLPTRAIFAFVIFSALLCAINRPAHAQTLTVLYSFPGQAGGASPNGDLVMDAKGNLYGTTFSGGNTTNCPPNSCGVIFEVTPQGQELVLHTFAGGQDGGETFSGLVRDSRGNLYGTVSTFGTPNSGLVFELEKSTGSYNVLYRFTGKPDGMDPAGKLVRDGQGNLYGVTQSGGTRNRGIVFKISPTGTEKVLHNFVFSYDGAQPLAGLLRDAQGNLYGTTGYGGPNNHGAIYKVTAGGRESVIYSFLGGFDGAQPFSALIQDATGALYGTTITSGTGGFGTVFEVTPAGVEFPLCSFGGSNGQDPSSALVRDAQGNLYGTAPLGGAFGHGVVFKVTPNGTETVLYSFSGGSDGSGPSAGLLMDAQGNFYGATGAGGDFGFGTLFKLVP